MKLRGLCTLVKWGQKSDLQQAAVVYKWAVHGVRHHSASHFHSDRDWLRATKIVEF
jgi:hypothetical protein